MHESGLVKNVLAIVTRAADQLGIEQVEEIGLTIGKTRAIVPEAMHIGMKVYSRMDPRYADCKLVIDERELILECPDCGYSGPADGMGVPCPNCGKVGQRVLQGNEFKVAYFRGKDPEENI